MLLLVVCFVTAMSATVAIFFFFLISEMASRLYSMFFFHMRAYDGDVNIVLGQSVVVNGERLRMCFTE